MTVYIEALEQRILGARLERVRLVSPFLLRSFDPPLREAEGRAVQGLRRLGKRIVIALDGDLFLVLHLMIAGRLRWREAGAKVPGKLGLAAFDFSTGTLLLTEAGTRKRAALHLVKGEGALGDLAPGGLEVFEADLPEFRAALIRENHTLKRSLTDPRLFSGIGNAYGDEILHRARLSPVKLSTPPGRRGDGPPLRGHPGHAARLDRPPARGDGRALPREGHCLSSRHGRARALRPALSRVRIAGPADRPRRERDQLLRALPDRWPTPGRPRTLAVASRGLAADPGRTGGTSVTLMTWGPSPGPPSPFVGSWAIEQLWLFWVGPLIGAVLARGVSRWLGGG